MEAPNLNHLWAKMIIEEFVRNGIRRFVIAPGSRSAPLAVQAFYNDSAETMVHFDERGAAFFALGCGCSGEPAAVICTSGTAVLNCWPAVAEAYYSGIPLVILSADRPPELQACGANQTMDQINIFGNHVRACLNLPCPDVQIPPESLLTKLDSVLAAGLLWERGPVHINCMFREPLAPIPIENAWPDSYMQRIKRWLTLSGPFTRWEATRKTLTPEQYAHLAKTLSSTEQGILVVGSLHTPEEQQAVLTLANSLRWPVLADITSGCRRPDLCPYVIPQYDWLLRSPRFRGANLPRCVLHLGDVVVSKYLQEFLKCADGPYIQISSRSDNRDPVCSASIRHVADIVTVCHHLTDLIEPRHTDTYLKRFLSVAEAVQKKCGEWIDDRNELTELTVGRIVAGTMPSDMALFIGNSMPIRDMDCLAACCGAKRIHANRGLSGIDGNIATASGMRWCSAAGAVALMGDVAALHDLNSLAFCSKLPSPLIILIINNHGGGIFSFLPISQFADVAQSCFINPHALNFESAAAMFNIGYKYVMTKPEFIDTLQLAIQNSRSMIMEIRIDSEKNLDSHRILNEEVMEVINSLVE